MKRILSMLMTLALLFTIMPAALAAGEGEITVTTNAAGVYDITDVKLYTTETVTGVKVNGTAIATNKITAIDGGISINAEDAATLGSAVIEVTSANGTAEVEALLTDFVEYKIGGTNQFYYGPKSEAKVDFENNQSFGWYGLTQASNITGVLTRSINTASKSLIIEASAASAGSSIWVRMPKLSAAIRPSVDDGVGRYVDLEFYADVKTADTTSRLNLMDVGGFSIGVDIFRTDGKCGNAEYNVSYDANQWYTLKAHLDSMNGLFEVYIKKQGEADAAYSKIYERSEEVVGPNFKQFGLAGYANNATTKFEIDNMYYEGKVAQPSIGSFRYLKDGAETAVGANAVPASATAFILKVEGSQADALSNIYIKDENGNKITAAVTGANSASTHVNDIITVTPQALTEGDYTLVIGKGTIIDNAETQHDRVFPFSVVATEFSATSPAEGAVIEQGETLNLACVAPGAATVTFTVNENEVAGTKAAKGSSFTASFNTASLPLGTVPVAVEATDSDGNQLNYEKRYVKIVKESVVNTTAATNWVQVSGADSSTDKKNQEYAQSPYETNSQTNGRRLFYTATNTAPTSAYVFQNTTKDIGYTGKVSMSFEMMVETTTDIVNYKVYANKTSFDMTNSTRVNYDAFNGLFNSNGKFYNTNVSYNANEWYKMKVVFDLDNMTKALYVNGDLLVEEKINDTFKCIGFARVMIAQTTLADRTSYAAVSIDNWTVDCEGGLYETAASYDSTTISDSRLIPETAENVTVTLNKNIASADNVKLYVNGSAVEGAGVSLADGNKITVAVKDIIKKGDKAEIRIGAGTSFKLATKVDAAVTSDVNAVTDADIVIPFVVGDKNLLYIDLVPSYTAGSAGAFLTSVNDGNVVYAMFVIAVYENEGGALKSVKKISASLQGENLIRLTNDTLDGGKFARAFLWNETTLVPLVTVQGSTLTE